MLPNFIQIRFEMAKPWAFLKRSPSQQQHQDLVVRRGQDIPSSLRLIVFTSLILIALFVFIHCICFSLLASVF